MCTEATKTHLLRMLKFNDEYFTLVLKLNGSPEPPKVATDEILKQAMRQNRNKVRRFGLGETNPYPYGITAYPKHPGVIVKIELVTNPEHERFYVKDRKLIASQENFSEESCESILTFYKAQRGTLVPYASTRVNSKPISHFYTSHQDQVYWLSADTKSDSLQVCIIGDDHTVETIDVANCAPLIDYCRIAKQRKKEHYKTFTSLEDLQVVDPVLTEINEKRVLAFDLETEKKFTAYLVDIDEMKVVLKTQELPSLLAFQYASRMNDQQTFVVFSACTNDQGVVSGDKNHEQQHLVSHTINHDELGGGSRDCLELTLLKGERLDPEKIVHTTNSTDEFRLVQVEWIDYSSKGMAEKITFRVFLVKALQNDYSNEHRKQSRLFSVESLGKLTEIERALCLRRVWLSDKRTEIVREKIKDKDGEWIEFNNTKRGVYDTKEVCVESSDKKSEIIRVNKNYDIRSNSGESGSLRDQEYLYTLCYPYVAYTRAGLSELNIVNLVNPQRTQKKVILDNFFAFQFITTYRTDYLNIEMLGTKINEQGLVGLSEFEVQLWNSGWSTYTPSTQYPNILLAKHNKPLHIEGGITHSFTNFQTETTVLCLRGKSLKDLTDVRPAWKMRKIEMSRGFIVVHDEDKDQDVVAKIEEYLQYLDQYTYTHEKSTKILALTGLDEKRCAFFDDKSNITVIVKNEKGIGYSKESVLQTAIQLPDLTNYALKRLSCTATTVTLDGRTLSQGSLVDSFDLKKSEKQRCYYRGHKQFAQGQLCKFKTDRNDKITMQFLPLTSEKNSLAMPASRDRMLVTESLLLLKGESTQKDWMLFETSKGIELQVPKELLQILLSEDWTICNSTLFKQRQVHLLLRSRDRLASIELDVSATQVVNLSVFRRAKYYKSYLMGKDKKQFQFTVAEKRQESRPNASPVSFQVQTSLIGEETLLQVELPARRYDQFAICGDYLCVTEESTICIFDLRPITEKADAEKLRPEFDQGPQKLWLPTREIKQNSSEFLVYQCSQPLLAVRQNRNSNLLKKDFEGFNLLEIAKKDEDQVWKSDIVDLDDQNLPVIFTHKEQGLIHKRDLKQSLTAPIDSVQIHKQLSAAEIAELSLLKDGKSFKEQDFKLFMRMVSLDSDKFSVITPLESNLEFLQGLLDFVKNAPAKSIGAKEMNDLWTALSRLELQLPRPPQQGTARAVKRKLLESTHEYSSFLQRSFESEKVKIRDTILSLALAMNMTALQVVPSITSFQNAVDLSSQAVIDQFNNCFIENEWTKKVTKLNWPKGVSSMTFTHKGLDIAQEFCQDKVRSKFTAHKSLIPNSLVRVTVMDLSFIFNNRQSFPDFISTLTKCKDNALFNTVLVTRLLDQFWGKNFNLILKRRFAPFMLHLSFGVTFLVLALQPDEDSAVDAPTIVFGALSSITWAILTYQEAIQMKSKLSNYFYSFWNWADLGHLVFFLIIGGVKVLPGSLISQEWLRILGAFATLAMLTKVFDWLRLFQGTAFYILLIKETFRDIGYFLILFGLSIAMFAVPTMLINLNREDEESLVLKVSGHFIVDSILSQYISGFNGYHYETIPENPQAALAVLFIVLSSLFTQITMMNMLIAIMGDTFGKVMESKDMQATRTKLDFLSDYDYYLRNFTTDEERTNVFLYSVQAIDAEEQDISEWQGTVHKIEQFTKKYVEQAKTQIMQSQATEIRKINEEARKDREEAQKHRQVAQQRWEDVMSALTKLMKEKNDQK